MPRPEWAAPVPPDMPVFDTPYRLDDPSGYREWRARKLDAYPASADALVVRIADLDAPSGAETEALVQRCRQTNMALFSTDGIEDKARLRAFGRRFGLERLDANLYSDDDGISSLQVSEVERKRDYIPYTNRRLNWHTDGYYNRPDQAIRAFLMYCVRDAAEGGENQLLDHEIAYILLRDEDPRLVEALMHPTAMTIPANVEQGVLIRPAETGPVFSVDPRTGNLHMRYSARTRNVQWRDDPVTAAATEFLQGIWENGSRYVYHHRLMPGEGLICNNVLHSRTGFRDDPTTGKTRLMYRARYFDRIAGTNFDDTYGGTSRR